MGKPYKIELQNLNQTYHWALEIPIEKFSSFIDASYDLPLIAVGSGGSLTAAYMAALLHQNRGILSKGITPLDFISSKEFLRDASVLILSAGGRNSDILSAFRFAGISEPRQLMALCMRTKSPLVNLSKEFRYSHFLDFDLPSGKDGFLATNSLIAFITILLRAYKEVLSVNSDLPENLLSTQKIHEQLNTHIKPLLERDTWVVLYGGWGLPAAIDAESKFTEAALKHIQIADYRNFAHGRHHWLAKRESETAIIALITPDEKEVAEKTLRLLPKTVPVLKLAASISGPTASLDLLVKMINLVHMVGTVQGIDPGKPRVPTFGRRIYHLQLSLKDKYTSQFRGMNRQEIIAILRKNDRFSLAKMKREDLEYWKDAYHAFIHKLKNTPFSAVIFDYDGTLCDPNERYIGLPKEIGQEIVRLLKGGIIVGIATGRGKSVRIDLQRLIPEEYWEQVLIGYYNGSDIATLKDVDHPQKSGSLHSTLLSIKSSLENNKQFCNVAKYEYRPNQITVKPNNLSLWRISKLILLDIVSKANVPGIQVLESSHSIDVIAPGFSKLALVAACEELIKQAGNPGVVLCVGDKGEWPGNDCELLSTPYSLSVDTVSPDPQSCWNLSRGGHRGVQATLSYLKNLEVLDGVLRFKTKKRERKL